MALGVRQRTFRRSKASTIRLCADNHAIKSLILVAIIIDALSKRITLKVIWCGNQMKLEGIPKR